MKERPILFSAPMVNAILDGRKTQTRRAIKNITQENVSLPDNEIVDCIKDLDGAPSRLDWAPDNWELCTYGTIGDRLWVRETHYRFGKWVKNGFTASGKQAWTFKPASNEVLFECPEAWRGLVRGEKYNHWWKRPSIFMPRFASRILLEITGTKVEKLNDISEDDAKAEGATPAENFGSAFTYTEGFLRIWERINGEDSLLSNPWLWVIKFKRIA